MPTSNAWKSTWAALDVHWLNSIPIDREIRARTDLPVLLTLIIIYFFPSPLLKRRRGVFRVSDALRDHPCWRVEGRERIFLFFAFLFFIIMGIRLEYACCFLLDLVLLSFCQSALSVRCSFLATASYCCSGVNWKTALLPPPLPSTFFFLSHLLFKKYQSHSSLLLLYHLYTLVYTL